MHGETVKFTFSNLSYNSKLIIKVLSKHENASSSHKVEMLYIWIYLCNILVCSCIRKLF